MRWQPFLAVLGSLTLSCGGDGTDPVDTEDRVSICNKTEVAWESAGTAAQAATVCASSWPSCDCFVIGGSHFEEDHFCMMASFDAVGQDVTITGDAGWSFDSTTPSGTDCTEGIPCMADLPVDTEIVAVASLPEDHDVEAQEVEITFTASAPRLEEIYVECP